LSGKEKKTQSKRRKGKEAKNCNDDYRKKRLETFRRKRQGIVLKNTGRPLPANTRSNRFPQSKQLTQRLMISKGEVEKRKVVTKVRTT